MKVPFFFIFSFFLFFSLILNPYAKEKPVRRLAPFSKLKKARKDLDVSKVKIPENLEVCFSPDEPCDLKLQKFIGSAKKTIDIAIYDINLDALVHALLIVSKKMQVRILVDQRQSKGTHSLVPLLIKAGAQIRYGRQRGVMHHKFALIDGKSLVTGSFNFTNHAATANRENQIYLSFPSVISRYQAEFNEIWENASLPHAHQIRIGA